MHWKRYEASRTRYKSSIHILTLQSRGCRRYRPIHIELVTHHLLLPYNSPQLGHINPSPHSSSAPLPETSHPTLQIRSTPPYQLSLHPNTDILALPNRQHPGRPRLLHSHNLSQHLRTATRPLENNRLPPNRTRKHRRRFLPAGSRLLGRPSSGLDSNAHLRTGLLNRGLRVLGNSNFPSYANRLRAHVRRFRWRFHEHVYRHDERDDCEYCRG